MGYELKKSVIFNAFSEVFIYISATAILAIAINLNAHCLCNVYPPVSQPDQILLRIYFQRVCSYSVQKVNNSSAYKEAGLLVNTGNKSTVLLYIQHRNSTKF